MTCGFEPTLSVFNAPLPEIHMPFAGELSHLHSLGTRLLLRIVF